jgi:hypothetical protein
MPDPIGDATPSQEQTAPIESDGLFEALSGMLDFQHPQNPRSQQFSADEESGSPASRTPANSATSGPDALAASLELAGDPPKEPAATEATTPEAATTTTDDSPPGGEPVAEGDIQVDEEGETPDPTAEATGDKPPEQLSRKERGARITQLEAEVAEWKRKAEAATPERTAADVQQARTSVLEFIGMKAPTDDGGRPTGDEAEFLALDKKAKGSGFEFEDEQNRYKELNERQGMVGTLYGVAREVAWEEMAAELADEALGLTVESIRTAGSVQEFKARYREAIEQSLGQTVTTTRTEAQGALEALRSEMGSEITSLKDQLAAATRQLNEQAAAHQSTLQRARAMPRAPFGGGSVVGSGSSSTGNLRGAQMGDLVSALAASLQESAEGR